MLKIKICGLKQPQNIIDIGRLKPDMAGFIFYGASPRDVKWPEIDKHIHLLPSTTQKVGVFVNEQPARMLELGKYLKLDYLQLHGQETPDVCRKLNWKFGIIKAFPIASMADFKNTVPYEGLCKYFLFDTKGPHAGGNGVKFDWNILNAYQGETPFLLSGGIAPGDEADILQLNHPKLAGVDLNSKFELSPGIKNVADIANFIETLRKKTEYVS